MSREFFIDGALAGGLSSALARKAVTSDTLEKYRAPMYAASHSRCLRAAYGQALSIRVRL